LTSSQAPAWEFSVGSSSFPSRKARALLTGFPSRSLGTRVKIPDWKVRARINLDHPDHGVLLTRIRLTAFH